MCVRVFQDWFTVSDRDGKCKERYLFLFKARILICKVRRISDDRSVFVLKEIIRVSYLIMGFGILLISSVIIKTTSLISIESLHHYIIYVYSEECNFKL